MMRSIQNSADCIKSELDLFYVPPTNTSIESGSWGEYYPIANIDNGPIEFVVPGSESEYIHLNKTSLYLKIGFYKIDNDKLVSVVESDVFSPICNFGSTVFSQVDVALNNTSFETSNSTYAYKAYLTDLLNYGEDAKNSFLQSSLFYKDDGNKFDSMDTSNNGFVNRKKCVTDSKGKLELLSKIHCDIFNSDRYLLNNIQINIKLIRNRDSFCLIQKSDTNIFTKIEKAVLIVRKCKISQAILLAHSMALEKSTAKYPIKRVVVKTFTIPNSLSSELIPNLSIGALPTRLVLGLVESESFNGTSEKNPFNFKHFDLNKISLTIDSKEVPYNQALKFDFENKEYIRGYFSLFEGIDRPVLTTGNNISREDYSGGYALYAYDLSPDLCSGDHFNLLKTGNLVLELTFSKSLTKPVTAVVYMEYDNLVEINKNRQLF